MTEGQDPQGAPPPAPSTPANKPDPVANFKAMATAEKMLAIAAAAALLGFIFSNGFKALFKYGWFPTCAFLGSLAVLVLTGMELFGVKVMDAKMRVYALILAALLPLLGYLIDIFDRMRFWGAVTLAAAIVMAYASGKIVTRDNLIKTD